MHLVALEDPGLTVFPTHRLVSGLRGRPGTQEALAGDAARVLRRSTELASADELPPPRPTRGGPLQLGYIDAHLQRPFRLTLKDQAIADRALADFPEPYRHLDTAILEALILTGPLGPDRGRHLALPRARLLAQRRARRSSSCARARYDVAFFLPGASVEQIGEIAAAGVNMPPKSTFFTPKVPTGLLFNPLS